LAECQTLLELSSIIPGTEQTQLVYNGAFQFQGELVNGAYPFPAGWIRAISTPARPPKSRAWAALFNGATPIIPDSSPYPSSLCYPIEFKSELRSEVSGVMVVLTNRSNEAPVGVARGAGTDGRTAYAADTGDADSARPVRV
jgi:hypothetical protein